MMKTIFLMLILIVGTMAATVDEAQELYKQKHYKEAVEIFLQHPDDPLSHYYLGRCYFFGEGVEENNTQSLHYFQLAVQDEMLPKTEKSKALWYLARIYQKGYGVARNLQKALEYAHQSANLGTNLAHLILAEIYYRQKKYPKALKHYLQVKEEHYRRNYDQSIPTIIGYMYQEGLGTPKDETKALMHYMIASKLGDSLAMFMLSEMYRQGHVVRKDLKQALRWLEKAWEAGNQDMLYSLGEFYRFDLKDYPKAAHYFQLALKVQKRTLHSKAQIHDALGLLYLDAHNNQKAYTHFVKAAKLGNYDHSYRLLTLVTTDPSLAGHRDEALVINEKAADPTTHLSDNQSLIQHHLYFYYQKHHLFDKAKELARKAYEAGNEQMGCELASYYSSIFRGQASQYNPDHNETLAFDLATRITQGENPSNLDLMSCYSALANAYSGGRIIPKDINKSLQILKKTHNDLLASDIGLIYLYQLNDYTEAKKWFQKAYEATKDPRYLSKVDDYIRDNPPIRPPKKTSTNILPSILPIVDTNLNIKQLVAMTQDGNKTFLSTINKSIRVYDTQSKQLIRTLHTPGGYGLIGTVIDMVFDKENNRLYGAPMRSKTDAFQNNLIYQFDVATGKILRTFQTSNPISTPHPLSLSDDGQYLLVREIEGIEIIETATDARQWYTHPSDAGQHSPSDPDPQPIVALFLKGKMIQKGDEHLAYLLDQFDTLWIYSVERRRRIGHEPYRGQITFDQHDEHEVEIAKTFIENNASSITVDDAFRLFQRVTNIKDLNTTHSAPPSPIDIRYTDDNTTTEIYDRSTKKLLASISLPDLKILNHFILDDQHILLILKDSAIIVDQQSDKIVSLEGDNIDLDKFHFYNNHIFYGAGDDNIIYMWDLHDLNGTTQSWIDATDSTGKMHQMLSWLMQENDPKQWEQMALTMQKQYHMPYRPTKQQLKSFLKVFSALKTPIRPLASFYAKSPDEWILYTPNGFFDSSPKGRDLLRYHINQGWHHEARIVRNSQIYEKFYRPDLLHRILSGQHVDQPMDIRAVLHDIKPPSVALLRNRFVDEKNLEVLYRICDNGSGIAHIALLLNGVVATSQSSRGFRIASSTPANSTCQTYQSLLTLPPGKNTITIQAYDREKIIAERSQPITIEANYTPHSKPDLHIITLATSHYQNPAYTLKYPILDAEAITAKFLKKSRNLFGQIHTYPLYDTNATRQSFKKLFTTLSQQIDVHDVLVLFIAGHGVTSQKDGQFYFLSYDADGTTPDQLSRHTISVQDIQEALGSIPTPRSLIMVDACQSGTLLADLPLALQTRMMADHLAHATGRNYLVASGDKQVALEGYKQHGVFSYAVLDAFDKAYFGDETLLTVSSLATYVEQLVPRITRQHFHYEQKPQKILTGESFPIGER